MIATISVTDRDLCEFRCYLEHNCVSINFEVKPSASGTHSCELNNSTHKEHEKDLERAANYVYHGTDVRIVYTEFKLPYKIHVQGPKWTNYAKKPL